MFEKLVNKNPIKTKKVGIPLEIVCNITDSTKKIRKKHQVPLHL
jgi:hypothetical protein